MEARSLSSIAAACQGQQIAGSPDTKITRVGTDSRQLHPGDVFFALAGEHFDGHDFLDEAARKGAAALVVNRSRIPNPPFGCGLIAVDDTRLALGRLGARYRSEFSLPVIAVAGSNGKTTTKDMLAAVLRQKFDTLASEASFNNDLGVPLTLLKLERRHAMAVLEAGTNHPGELGPLLQMIGPRFGVLTCIGREHLEFFGDMAGVAHEEGSLAEVLPAEGRLFLNGDSEWAAPIEARSRAAVVRIGFSGHNHWSAERVRLDERGVSFHVLSPRAEFCGPCRVNLLGRHQVLNSLLALAVGAELGLSPDQARRGLAACMPPRMRMQVWEVNGVRVLDDAYNANADSMRAALETLHDLPCAGRRIAVLGDMAELGDYSAVAHSEVGQCTADLKLSWLIAVGKWARHTAAAAREGGLKQVSEFPDVPSAAAALKGLVRPGDLVLLKASRAVGLERIGEALRGLAAAEAKA